jgi:phosphatidate cytidylyltransferase
MATFREPGRSIERMARTSLAVAYLGLLPSFFAQIRWQYPTGSPLGTTALALAIFVPKGCDIGAYFTGRLIGKHKMTPILSPKKTWEGAIGGLAFAALAAVGIDRLGPAAVLRANIAIEIAFGLTVGIAGMLGDLAESLIKRDCQQKDASQTVPGFGGVLDVVDAVIFAGPVAYLWYVVLAMDGVSNVSNG